MFCVGKRGRLTYHAASVRAYAFRTTIAAHPRAYVILNFAGYDDDPRALWEFPDVCRYAQKWADFAGVANPDAPFIANLSESSVEILTKLGVFRGNVHGPLDAPKQ
jgi:hypothetical protein